MVINKNYKKKIKHTGNEQQKPKKHTNSSSIKNINNNNNELSAMRTPSKHHTIE